MPTYRESWPVALLLLGLLVAVITPAFAQDAPSPAAAWPMESVKLKDGRTLQGLIQSQREGEIEFIEIVRPPGKPMFGVLHPLARQEVESITELPKPQRAALARRFQQFRHRAVVEAGRMESLSLASTQRDGQRWITYDGPWFSLESSADETTTRRCIVRIEQTFRAYRLILPPSLSAERGLRVRLYGSMDDYRTHLRKLGLEIANPAYFSSGQNEIAAGSDLSSYAAELAKATAHSEATRQEYQQLDRQLPDELRRLGEELQLAGFSQAEIKSELQARRAAWTNELRKLQQKLAEIQRRNEAKFSQVTEEMFRRLSHEAFHAYVENYVFSREQAELPRWLNEGLAQIFESGQLEADVLRVDAPSRGLLERLQADIHSKEPLEIRSLLSADARQFVKLHGSEATDRNYLYAWGLAWYLTFEYDLLREDRLATYVAGAAKGDGVKAFEQFVGKPVHKFEEEWRAAMLRLKPPR